MPKRETTSRKVRFPQGALAEKISSSLSLRKRADNPVANPAANPAANPKNTARSAPIPFKPPPIERGAELGPWPAPWTILAGMSLITIVATMLRVHLLGAPSLWVDEAASVTFASLPFKAFLKTLWHTQGNMTLYYFLLRGWIHLGTTEVAIRSLSVIFGVMAIPLAYLVAARLFDRPTGMISAALLAIHSFHVHWSRDARAYSLLVFLLLLTTWLFLNARERNRTRDWIAFTVSAALCVYAHIFAVLVLVAFVVALLFPARKRLPTLNLILIAVLFEHLVAPMAMFVLVKHPDALGWVQKPTLSDAIGFAKTFTGDGGLWLLIIYSGLCLVAAFSRPSEREQWGTRFLLVWMLLPPALVFVASFAKPMFENRFMVMCVPALVMLAAHGIVKLWNRPVIGRWVAPVAFAALIGLSSIGVSRYFQHNDLGDWRAAVNYLSANTKPGDGAIFYIPDTYSYSYYAGQIGRRVPEIIFPEEVWRPLSPELMSDITSKKDRVWLVLYPDAEVSGQAAIMRSSLAPNFRLLNTHEFAAEYPITLALYERDPAIAAK
jgi:mannosyltransferase